MKFRYDYNCKMLIFNIFVSLLFLIILVSSYDKGLVLFCIFGIVLLICVFNTIVLIYNQGITVRKKSILIIDYFWFSKINMVDLKRVEIIEIKKEKKNNLYGFLNEFYHPSTFMYNSDYVYNNGRVFKIVFYLKDNTTKESYFGWMYKEKNISKINRVIKKMERFVNDINLIVQEKNKIK